MKYIKFISLFLRLWRTEMCDGLKVRAIDALKVSRLIHLK